MKQPVTRRRILGMGLAASGAVALAACGATPTPQVIEKTVVVKETQVVEKEVTKVVEGTPQVVKETVVVEKVVQATPAPETKHSITFAWHTGGEGANKVFAEAVSRFELSHPNYTVSKMPVPYSDYADKLQVLYAGGTPPDSHTIPWGFFGAFAAKGVLADIQPFVDRDRDQVQPDDYWPGAWSGMVYRGTRYSLPRETIGLIIMEYNKDIFKAASLPNPGELYSQKQWTFDKWRESAKALTQRDSSGRLQQVGTNSMITGDTFDAISRDFCGPGFFDENMTKTLMDDPKNVALIQLFTDMMNVDKSMARPEETKEFDFMSSGKQAMAWSFTFSIPNDREVFKFDWDFAPPPSSDCTPANVAGYDFYAMNAKSKDLDGAWEIIKFFNSPPEDLWWGLNMFGAPFHKSNLEPWLKEIRQKTPPSAGWDTVKDMLSVAHPVPNPVAYTEIVDILSNELSQAINGSRPVDEVVKSVTAKINDALAKAGG